MYSTGSDLLNYLRLIHVNFYTLVANVISGSLSLAHFSTGKILINNSPAAGKQTGASDVIKQRFAGAASLTMKARPTLWSKVKFPGRGLHSVSKQHSESAVKKCSVS